MPTHRDFPRCLLALAPLVLFASGVESHAQSLTRKLRSEGIKNLASAAQAKGDALRGAILFPRQELGCANCHTVGSANLLGPDLTGIAKDLTYEHLVESILLPSKVIRKGFRSTTVVTNKGRILTGRLIRQDAKELLLRVVDRKSPTSGGRLITLLKADVERTRQNPVSAMPDNLVDQLDGRQAFLDLVKYTMQLALSRPQVTRTAQQRRPLSADLRGLQLLDKLQCAACHKGIAVTMPHPARRAPELAWSAGGIRPDYLKQFIADPHGTKPGTSMPDVMHHLPPKQRRESAESITHYLISIKQTTFAAQPNDAAAAVRGRALFHSIGCVACHAPRDAGGRELQAGSFIPLGRLERKYYFAALVGFLKDPHIVRPFGRMPKMRLTHWEAQDIAHFLLKAGKEPSADASPTVRLDRDLVDKGKRKFTQLGCAKCHAPGPVEPNAPPLDRRRTEQGCLSTKPGKWPRYRLTNDEREAIRAAIARKTALTDEQQITLTLATFNCLACHSRGDQGGIAADRDEFFLTSHPNLGPQGRVPPSLTGVGAKLNAKAIRDVLVNGHSIRPYMKTRMPQFGAENMARLIELLERVDRPSPVSFAKFSDRKEMRNAGVRLAGNQGLNCIACHTFQEKSTRTMPAVDLTVMAARLKKGWFYEYMRNPQRFHPGTVMPSFWPGGKSLRADVLNGQADLQIEALWQYLLDGRQARRPRGLIIKPIVLVATDEAVMLRRSYPDIGKRGIGVGYPRQVNLAFDAEQMRLAMIWKGRFADPGGVWRSQGHGRVRPLGSELVRFEPGPELDDLKAPWQVDKGRPPRHQFKGYYLDARRRPTFMYRYDGIEVEDYPVDPKTGSTGPRKIRRTLTFSSPRARQDVAFRAATGRKITAQSPGSYLIDGKLRLRVIGNSKGQVSDLGKVRQLRIPLQVGPTKSTLILEYVW